MLALIVLATLGMLVPFRFVRPKTELTMTVWGMPFEDRLFHDGYALGFEALHPGVHVNYQRYQDIMAKYEAWHAVGRGADVMRMGIDAYRMMVRKGMLLPLNKYINDPKIGLTEAEKADFLPTIWQALDLNGERYALPSDNALYGLYYNRKIFDAYNAAHPEAPLTYPSADWTWDDVRRAARLLTIKEGNRTTQYGVSFELWSWPFLSFLGEAGGEAWDADGTTTLINSEAGVEAMTFISELIDEDSPIRSTQLADTGGGPIDLFKTGRLAILCDGSWRAPNLELDAPDLDFAISMLPHYRRRAVAGGSVVWGVSAHSRNPELAFQMVKWLVSRDQSLRYWDTLRVAPPALTSLINSPQFEETHGVVQKVGGRERVVVPAMPRANFAARAQWIRDVLKPDPATGVPPRVIYTALYQADLDRAVGSALTATLRRAKTPREALDAAAKEVHTIIDRDRAARGLPPVRR
jgi:multiple sugar transport system substrate-binding protein